MLTGLRRSLYSKSWLVDLPLVALAWWAAFWLRFNLSVPQPYFDQALRTLPLALAGMALALLAARVPRQSWRHVSLADLRRLAGAVALGALLTAAAVLWLRVPGFPRSVFVISAVLVLLLLAAARAAWRSLMERTQAHGRPGAAAQPLLLVGTLDEADQALRTLKGAPGWQVVGIASPRAQDAGRTVQGVRVLGGVDALDALACRHQAETALLASAPGDPLRREVLLRWSGTRLNLLTLPTAQDWLAGEGAAAAAPRRVALEDLLGREAVQLDAPGLAGLISGQTVMVTGAGGSIGAELCRQIARFGAARLVCVDVSEFATYTLEQALRRQHPQLQGLYCTANVREPQRLLAIARQHRPVVVFHAAAYKHVPLMEHNEIEALRTNVLGTLHAARAAGEAGAARFVLVSTDKAVNPTSVMGASKRLAERVVQGLAPAYPGTRFVSVRFGNVLGSSGSVVPLFAAQIARGGPVTVTHPDIVRYFMTIPEAAQLVLQAGWMGESGQIFVLDMGEPVRIAELARLMIRLSGKREAEVPIVFTGLRPGEKLYEELLASDETTEPTPHPKLRISKASVDAGADAEAVARWIDGPGSQASGAALRQWLHAQVPEYRGQPPCGPC